MSPHVPDLVVMGCTVTYLTLLSGLDDSASAASSMEVSDRIASLEQRVQMQEDDIQLLKSALADVVRRLNITEEQQAVLNRKGPTKGGHEAESVAALNILTPALVTHPKTDSRSKCPYPHPLNQLH